MTDEEYTRAYVRNRQELLASMISVVAALIAIAAAYPLSGVGLLPLAFAAAAGFMAYYAWDCVTGGSQFKQATINWLLDSYGIRASAKDITDFMNGRVIEANGSRYALLRNDELCKLIEV